MLGGPGWHGRVAGGTTRWLRGLGMLVSQAHSFRQQARLAVTLAWVGGYTNMLTVLVCGVVTSHMSGIASGFGRDVAEASWQLAAYALFLLVAFVLGAAASGFCTELGRRRGWDSIYVLPVIVETALLGGIGVSLYLREGLAVMAPPGLYWITGAAAAAMGLQNATITRISSGTVRTTHVTGVLTDLGHEAVQFFWWLADRRRDVPPGSARGFVHSAYVHPTTRRLALLAAIVLTFIIGAGFATAVYDHAPRWAMFPPVAFLGWIIYADLAAPIAEIEPWSRTSSPDAIDLPSSLAVFHLRKADGPHHGRRHRMPNLLTWSERLPAATRVVILDVAGVDRVNANAAMELRALVERFAAQGRALIVSGVTHEHAVWFAGGSLLPPDHVCPDFDLAVARALNLVDGPGGLSAAGMPPQREEVAQG
jgi:uncharacterized membrane protein YoaK (UPF0700 family)